MAETPNKLVRFWHELNRRGVLRVITTYAATSYIIIQVVNNLLGPLNMPQWVATAVIIALAAGFPVVIILSWIFDLTPQGIKKTESSKSAGRKGPPIKPARRRLKTSDIVIAVLLVVVVVLAYPKIINRNSLDSLRSRDGKISIAIMPFENMTGDSTKRDWPIWIQDGLINSLSEYIEDLSVTPREDINAVLQNRGITNYATIAPSVAGSISKSLDANILISGSIKPSGNRIHLSANLRSSGNGAILKPFQLDGPSDSINVMVDSISRQIKGFLEISELKERNSEFNFYTMTISPLAFSHFSLGDNAFGKGYYSVALESYLEAVKIDSNFVMAAIQVASSYENQGMYEQAKQWCLRYYLKKDLMPPNLQWSMNWVFSYFFQTPNDQIKNLEQILFLTPQAPTPYRLKGYAYIDMNQYEKAIPELEKSNKLDIKINSKPFWATDYIRLGKAYHETGQYKKERKLYKEGEKYFPDNPAIIYRQAILALKEGKTEEANEYIKKFISVRKDNSVSEAIINAGVAGIYAEAGLQDKAEEYYRQALSLEPENPSRINSLGFYLIDKERNINEGLDLINKALALRPEHYLYLDSKGWGLFKQGKTKEALAILQKADSLKPVYNHRIYLHLEAAKKAVAGMR